MAGGAPDRSSVLVMHLPPATATPLDSGTGGAPAEAYTGGAGPILDHHGGIWVEAAVDRPGGPVWLAARFADASSAVATAVALVPAFVRELGSPAACPGMAIHTGTPADGVALAQLAHGGQVLVSPPAAQLLGRALPPGVNLQGLGTHRLRDLQSSVALFQLQHPDLPADFGPPKSLDHLPHNLPAQLTSFVGRADELARLGPMLAGSRLVTLTGAGGIGKTRLALQAAAEGLDRYADGAWLVELAPLAEPDLVPQALATALGVREEPGRSLTETLADYLEGRETLLVLDNCEHLVAACANLADGLLRACPGLRILATSREALGVAGEVTWAVPPLATPDPAHAEAPARLADYAAVQLFAQRAAAAQPGFRLTEQNAAAVAAVCHRLDGIPLAIELAAAWVRLLPLAEMATRLEQSLALLVAGRRTEVPRHQTLRAAVAWSHGLLSEPERVLWRRLAVFAGGFTLPAAEAVAGGDGLDAGMVLPLLAQLTDKSVLVTTESAGNVRPRMLEPLRQYGLEQLPAADEADSLRHRHLEWCLAQAGEAAVGLEGPDQVGWLERLDQEHDNLRAALGWSLGAGHPPAPESGLRLAATLGPYWEIRGHLHEGRRWLDQALGLAPPGSALRAQLLNGAALLARAQGDHAQAISRLTEALAIGRAGGDWRGEAFSLLHLGRVRLSQCEFPAARTALHASLTIWREVGNARGVAWALNHLGSVALHTADYAEAGALFAESLARMRELGDQQGIARLHHAIASVYREQGEYDHSHDLLAQGVNLARSQGIWSAWPGLTLAMAETDLAIGDLEQAMELSAATEATARKTGAKPIVMQALAIRGRAALYSDDTGVAARCLEEGVAMGRHLGDRFYTAICLSALGRLAQAQGDVTTALTHAAEALRLQWQIGARSFLAWSLEAVGGIIADAGDPAPAVRLLGAAADLRETIGAPMYPVDRPEYERIVSALRAELGDEGYAAAWAAGRSDGLFAAVAAALERAGLPLPETAPITDVIGGAALGDTPAPHTAGRVFSAASTTAAGAAHGPATSPSARLGGLTARELEIARLVAEGLTDREVAARLHISPRTVDTHLRNIFGKVAVSSRTGLAAWVLRQGTA